jgi:cyanophycinase
MLTRSFCRCACVAILLSAPDFMMAEAQGAAQYNYFRMGSANDVAAKTEAGFALMGGGKDLDEAFRWMCERAGGGDFLVLRASGDDDYNPYIQPLCKLNSVATLILPNREAANDKFVAQTIAHAEAIFIAGGDQANYIRYWMGTPVQAEINAAIQRGVPVGGTSAGLAVMGDWVYSAEGDKPDGPNLDAKTALMNPMGPQVTLVHGFLEIPVLKGIITDSHFAKRDRMGRLLVFLADLNTAERKRKFGDRQVRGLGIDQEAAVLLNRNGGAVVVGNGSAYLVEPAKSMPVPEAGKPLDSGPFLVRKIRSQQRFDLFHAGEIGDYFQLTVAGGVVHSSRPGNSNYGGDTVR